MFRSRLASRQSRHSTNTHLKVCSDDQNFILNSYTAWTRPKTHRATLKDNPLLEREAIFPNLTGSKVHVSCAYAIPAIRLLIGH